jgi:hypothetical protein
MRKFERVHTEKGRNIWWTKPNKGLKKVNIGSNIWLYGRQKYIDTPDPSEFKNKTILHMVIYGPENKEYHVWGDDVKKLSSDDDYGNNGNVNRDGNTALEERVKVHILTSILDDSANWCFDLTKIPDVGKLKVIYDNGTVKNIDFDGVFSKIDVVDQFWKNKLNIISKKEISPIGYRNN